MIWLSYASADQEVSGSILGSCLIEMLNKNLEIWKTWSLAGYVE